MHGGVVEGPGYYLHGFFAAQRASVQWAGQQLVLAGEQPAVPLIEAFKIQQALMRTCGIEQQLCQAFGACSCATCSGQPHAASQG